MTWFLTALALYGVVGLFAAAAFVLFGVGRVLPHQTTFTAMTRLFLFPGAVALWPYILLRWLRTSRT